ncbi:MAG: C39 family peptidase [Phycisphaerales bacterium]|nr:C39 family peptidase [Phycisphaerales bacterium]MCC7412714.1 C39 family peptidase [Gammaproteobacteria bacterium]
MAELDRPDLQAAQLAVRILRQPDARSCGPTCLHSVYRYYGTEHDLDTLIGAIEQLESGGTLDVFLACDALRRGFEATIYTYNLQVFDPTWFAHKDVDMIAKLEAQIREKRDRRLRVASQGYQEFLRLGGRIRFTDLTRRLLRSILNRGIPIITGLSATYLYRAMREYGPDDADDDVRGAPAGHFVVLSGYERRHRTILVSDPLDPNPLGGEQNYWIHIDRVIGAILLGVLTHDANLLVIQPRR